MQLRAKAITIVALTSTVLFALLFVTSRLVLERYFHRLELHDVRERIQQAQQGVAQVVDFIDRKVVDWALWDDSYHYMEKPDQAWFEDNVNAAWMKPSGLNVCVMIDRNGRIVGQRAYDLEHDQIASVPEDLQRLLAAPSVLTRMEDPEQRLSGLLPLSDGVLLLAARPSLDNNGSGPSHGVIIFGRWLDTTELKGLSSRLGVPIALVPQSAVDPNHVFEQGVAVVPVDAQQIHGFFRIPDIFGGTGQLLRIDCARDIATIGRQASMLLLLATGIATVLFGGVLIFMLHRTVVARVARLNHEVESAGQRDATFTSDGDDEIGRLAGTIGRMHAALGDANAALAEARDQALASAKAKADFLASVSHEVRTPMNGVLGMTRLLQNTPLTDEQRELVDVLRTSGDNLLTLVNDILDMSKIEAGKLEIESVPFSPSAVIEETMVMLAERAHAKGLELAGIADQSVPAAVRGDPGRFRQIIVNLVANAVKFTERGEVVVRLTSVPTNDRGTTRLQLTVNDTGIGIPEEMRNRIFERFTQADSSTFRRFGGTGLGLSICKHLVERMGGTISVESQPGKGSSFTAQIIAGVCEGPSGRVAICAEAETLSGKRLLIIDDHAATREVMCRALAVAGMVIDEAQDFEAAHQLTSVSKQSYNVVIVDQGLLGTQGNMQQLIARVPGIAGVPVLLALPLAAKERAPSSAGFAAMVSKPVRAAQIRAALHRVFGQEGDRRPASVARDPVVHGGLRVLVIDDSPINCKVAVGMLERISAICETANNGQEGLVAFFSGRFDLVLLDCQMPVMDGYAMVQELRRREGTGRRTRVIALTADATHGARERCLAAGMDDYLVKPMQYEDLLAALRRSPIPRLAASTTHSDEPLELDRGLLDQIRILGDEGFRGVIDRYLDQGPQRIADIVEALAAGDAKRAAVIAHQLVGESGLVGLRRVEAQARAIEVAARGQGVVGETEVETLRRTFDRGASLLRDLR